MLFLFGSRENERSRFTTDLSTAKWEEASSESSAEGGSLHGEYVDATPFANSKKANEKTQPKSETLVDELGEMLKASCTCSDYHIAAVCSTCGSILTPSVIKPEKRVARAVKGLPPVRAPKVFRHACDTNKGRETVAMPYVFKYLAAELAAMSIKMTLQLSI
ncbi:hypothetical protein GBA52_022686 [Prunus armeniaca]|nr:hypothetical protein GBA52_022686 [Prunus armeniaca]